ncbi:MAG: hypothetical protein HF978_17360 [Desulfobacteraceae bacterium]|nr:hypothetical protein [Desulfobacteraceae bacterium]MBC2757314.1 hypothetical protein [Desulfobacteraceae bacterium]
MNYSKSFLLFSAVFLAIVFALGACTYIAPPEQLVSQPDGYRDWGKTPPGPKDRARHHIDGEKPFEWWYFDGHLDNGQTFVGVFHVPNFVTGNIEAMFTLYTKDWVREEHIATLNPEEVDISYDDISIETPAGFVRRIDDKTYHVKWTIDDIDAEFKLTTFSEGWIPHEDGGRVNQPDMDFFWAVHQGRNTVNGTITRNGKTQTVSGVGYADHNWGKKPLNEITRKWIWGRIIAKDYTIIYADVDYYEPGLEIDLLYIAKGKKVIVGSGSPYIRQWDFETHPGLKRHYPNQVDIEFDSKDVSGKIFIKKKRLVEECDLLEIAGYNSFSQWIIKTFFARPIYFRVIADFEGSITTDGKTDTINGECLYEVMGFE